MRILKAEEPVRRLFRKATCEQMWKQKKKQLLIILKVFPRWR